VVIDVHSHFWEHPTDFTSDFREQAKRAKGGTEFDLTVRYEDYRAACRVPVRTVVFGGKARLSGVWVDDRRIANYVAAHPDTLIGFLSVDPTQPDWEKELRDGHEVLGLRGIKLLPMYAGFNPADERLEPLWHYAVKHRLPVLLHTGTTFVSQAPLEYTLPRHLDTVAIRHPDVKLILAHLGHPYEGECVVVIRKHPNVFADLSALHYRPFQFYHSLMLVQEYGVWDKVLFGTDYPFTTVNATLDGLRNLNAMLEGTALPRLNEAKIEALIGRDTCALLGLK
jgi:uncharacterized protein